MNKAMIMGRLTRDPELKNTTSGTPVLSFAVAVDRQFKPKDGERETDFINCVAWRGTAEFISKWWTKGKMIAVSGSIQTRKYTDRDGNARTATEIVVEDVYFCGDKNGDGGGERRTYSQPPQNAAPGYRREDETSKALAAGDFADLGDEDELPF